MFFYKKGLIRRIRVHPKYIGGKESIRQVARRLAKQDIRENYFTVEHGYVVRLIRISELGEGRCMHSHGFIEFTVNFEAVLLFPVVGETVDAEVVMVDETSITFRHACVFGVVRAYTLNSQDDFVYEKVDTGAGAKGPKKVKGPSDSVAGKEAGLYRSRIDEEKVIAIGTCIRLKIIQRTLGGNGFFLIGSMSGDFLGPLQNTPPLPVPPPPPAIPLKDKAEERMEVDKVEASTSGTICVPVKAAISHTQLQKLWKEAPYNNPSSGASSPAFESMPD